MKDLIKVIKRYCRRDVYNQDDYVLNEEDFTTIAESIVVDEDKVGDIVENFCSGNEERPGESYEKWSERFVEALSKGDILKVVE